MIDLAKLKELLAVATPGPWKNRHKVHVTDNTPASVDFTTGGALIDGDGGQQDFDADFIAAARNQLPELIALLEEARELLRVKIDDPDPEWCAQLDAWLKKAKE